MEQLESPRYPQAWFGDGMWVQVIRKRRHKDHKGRHGWLFLIRPSRELLNTYGKEVRDQIDKETGYILEWYPEKWVKLLSDDPVTAKILIKCNFLRETTPLCDETADKDQTIEDQERLIDNLTAGNAHLHEQIEMMQTNMHAFMKGNVDLIIEARRAGGKIKTEEDESKEESQH